MTTTNELASAISSSLFATRDSISEAYEELTAAIFLLPIEHRAGILVGTHVLLNTIAKEIKKDV